MWYSNDMFHHMLKAEFVTPVRLKVPSGVVQLGGGRGERRNLNNSSNNKMLA